MKRLATILLLLCSCAMAQEVVLTCKFDSADARTNWSSAGKIDGGALLIERTSRASVIASTALPVEKMRGHTVIVSARVKAENVSSKPQSWNGIKLMVPL